MSKSMDSSLVLTGNDPQVLGTRPLRRSQPLQIIQEEEEDETHHFALHNDLTSSYAINELAAPTLSILDEVLYQEEDAAEDAPSDDFFTIEEETDLLLPPPTLTGLSAKSLGQSHGVYGSYLSSSSGPLLSRTVSHLSLASMASTDTFLTRDPNTLEPTIPLSSLLDVISRHRSLQQARIVRADSYQKFNGRVIHRFIILELERDQRQKIWLRIDRRRDESLGLLNFVANRAKAPSDDRAWLSADKYLLSEGLNAEHTTLFEGVVPTLGDLRWVFLAIVRVLKRYELFGANCWFMVSFIYECLDEIYHASAVARFLYMRKGSEEVRREIRTAARLIIAFPFEEVPSYLIEQYGGINNFYYAMLGHHIDTTDDTAISLARLLSNFQNAIPEWLLLQIFMRFSDHNSRDKIPRSLENTISRLSRLFNGGRLNGGAPRLQRTFELFLLDSSIGPLSLKIVPPEVNRLHITTCLDTMAQGLRFNICKLSTSFKLNEDVSNLEALSEANLSSHLRYASHHWADRVSQLENLDGDLVRMLSTFFETQFLYWLEVMVILHLSPVETLETLNKAHILRTSEKLAALIKDAWQFVETFKVPILESVPHIYISALAFTPLSSSLFSNLRGSLRRPAVARSGILPNWLAVNPIIHVALGHGFVSLTFSPDGRFLVSGLGDGRLQLWDVNKGEAISELLSGHEDPVWSVAFSPDGTLIASGSNDRTIRLWDVATRREIGLPLTGHIDAVSSVAFSPDGTQLVSGSWDSTLRRWDTRTGSPIGEPLQGHFSDINSIVFSPDGTRIASASNDKTIRIWDAETGEAIGKSMEGHSGWVRDVAFSPDGSQIASASDDMTVRRWDARTGEPIGKPFEGHSDLVRSVAFSPDGRWIASGSRDNMVRLWDARTGEAVGEPLNAHSDSVWTVAFSPDSKLLASCSYDQTLRLWQCSTEQSDDQSRSSSSHSPTTPISHHQGAPTPLHSSPTTQHEPLPLDIVCPQNLPSPETLIFRKDGWIVGPNKELVLWVPLGFRNRVPFPQSEREVLDNIDFSNFACGNDWTGCWRESSEERGV